MVYVELWIGAELVEWRLAEKEVVQNGHAIPFGDQGWNQDRAEVSGPTGHENGISLLAHDVRSTPSLPICSPVQ